MAAVSSSRSIDVDAPPEVVWTVLTGFADWPQWNRDVKSMTFEGPVAPGSSFRWKAGPGTIVSTLEEVDPPRRVRWRGKTMSIAALHEYRFEARDGGTHVETEETFSGFLVSLMRGSLQKTLDSALEDGLRYLKTESERRAVANA
ncbi:MAG TPA: SRPBCC family protein [Gaiellaceae bacterium]|nr:SRPBCC family protein [Gaiellaceae bacterium]